MGDIMKIRLKKYFALSFSLLLLDIFIVLFLSLFYRNLNEKDTNSILQFSEDKINTVFEKGYLAINSTEAIVKSGYDEKTTDELDQLLEPFCSQLPILNISILPAGVVEYVYPLAGNEDAIGDNIFEMPNRREEALIAVQTKQPIVSGPYDLTQGGQGITIRKAVFMADENNNEYLWGLVAVVLDAKKVIEFFNLDMLEGLGFECELSANVNNLDKVIIHSSSSINLKRAKIVTIPLANGNWQLAIQSKINPSQIILITIVGLIGFLIVALQYKFLRKREYLIDQYKNDILTDNLTGLFNRKKLTNLELKLEKLDSRYTVFFIDYTDFKLINDTYGHYIGDQILIKLSEELQNVTSDNDLVIRVGGDEFIIILPNMIDEKDIKDFSIKLSQIQCNKYQFEGNIISLRFSFGYAVCPFDGEHIHDVIKKADENMYKVKRKNKETDDFLPFPCMDDCLD